MWFLLLQGEFCAQKPVHVIVAGVLLIAFCLLGLVRFKLETNPQQLWVGPGSRAAQDKANYEASFGPFYRVSQLILSTTPQSNGSYISTTGLPAIVTDANIQLLFDMQAKVDALSGERRGACRAVLCCTAVLLSGKRDPTGSKLLHILGRSKHATVCCVGVSCFCCSFVGTEVCHGCFLGEGTWRPTGTPMDLQMEHPNSAGSAL